MPLADGPAAREATAPVPMLQRPPQSGGNRPRPGPDFKQLALLVVAHHHAARIAREPAGRFPGNVAPLLQYGLAWLLGARQDCGVHMDHHLVPLPRGAGIELVMQRRLREQA
jgi:hypothetical protein